MEHSRGRMLFSISILMSHWYLLGIIRKDITKIQRSLARKRTQKETRGIKVQYSIRIWTDLKSDPRKTREFNCTPLVLDIYDGNLTKWGSHQQLVRRKSTLLTWRLCNQYRRKKQKVNQMTNWLIIMPHQPYC